MLDLTTAARLLATESGARLHITPGVAYDTADAALAVMVEALLAQAEGAGIDLIELRRVGTSLTALIDDSGAGEPLSPGAFSQAVRRLSYERLGEVWDGRFTTEAGPAVPAQRVRVA